MKPIKSIQVSILLTALLLGGILPPASPAEAANIIVVEISADEDKDDDYCTLREAIIAANTDAAYRGCGAGSGADTITFSNNFTITLFQGKLPVITQPLTITGNGITSSAVQASPCNPVTLPFGCTPADFGVFEAGSGLTTLTINHLTIRNGYNGSPGNGGGIQTPDSGSLILTINNSNIEDNYAVSNGGGIALGAGTLNISNTNITGNYAGSDGAGVYASGVGTQVTISNSTLSGNEAGLEGGGLALGSNVTATITNSTLSGNNASSGAGIHDTGSLTLGNSTISGNASSGQGGGLYMGSGSSTIIKNSTFSNNSGGSGGGLYLEAGGTLNFMNTLAANSRVGGDCVSLGTISVNTSNLIEDNSCSPALSGDPVLGPLAYNGGPTATHAPRFGSPAIDQGYANTCANVLIGNLDQRGVVRGNDGNSDGVAGCDIGSYESHNRVFRSNGLFDGWVLESTEISNRGGLVSPSAPSFNLGDNAGDRQYRAILSFDTTGLLPANAVITGAILRIKKQGVVGTNPFLTHGALKIDMKKPYFGAIVGLAKDDFNAMAGKVAVAKVSKTPSGRWYSSVLSPAAYSYINRNGKTQFRLRFAFDDNDDLSADFIKFFSGDATTATDRPMLILEYYVP